MCGRISIWDLKQLDKEYGPWKKEDNAIKMGDIYF